MQAIRIIISILVCLIISQSRAFAGLIFDNGSGDKNDTLVIQFCLIDSSGLRFTPWDTAYVIQAYGGVDFNVDTLVTSSNYDLNAAYPRNLMFEYRLLASDNVASHLGAFTWWVHLVDSNNGTDSHQMHYGSYYVSDEAIENLAALDYYSRNLKVTSGGEVYANFDSSGGSLSSTQVESGVSVSLNNSSISSQTFQNDAITSNIISGNAASEIRDSVWMAILTNYPGINNRAAKWLIDLHDYTDGTGAEGIGEDIGDPSDSSNNTRVAWASDDSLGSGSGGADTLQIKAMLNNNALFGDIDTIRTYLGKDGQGTPQVSLHMKLGGYSGQSGDNNNVRDDIGALSLTGNGSESCTLIARQNGVNPIQGARIIVRTLDGSSVKVPGIMTSVEGAAIVELDAADYLVSISANNYSPLIDTLSVNRDSLWDFSLALFDPGNPPAPDLCRVYGWVYDIAGDSLAGAIITAEMPSEYSPVKFGNIVITPFKKLAFSDSTGYWSIDLFPNGILSNPNSMYQFSIETSSGVAYKNRTAVPDSISWQLK